LQRVCLGLKMTCEQQPATEDLINHSK
jgi:hypothetical protein